MSDTHVGDQVRQSGAGAGTADSSSESGEGSTDVLQKALHEEMKELLDVVGPAPLIDKMAALQQYTFVCAPHPLQHAAVEAFSTDMSAQVDAYRQRRDHVVAGLRDAGYEVAPTGGAFYVFPKVPDGWSSQNGGTATEFVGRAIENELLVIPGGIFSRRDTHFRISYAAPLATIDRGLEVLRRLARG